MSPLPPGPLLVKYTVLPSGVNAAPSVLDMSFGASKPNGTVSTTGCGMAATARTCAAMSTGSSMSVLCPGEVQQAVGATLSNHGPMFVR